MLKWKYGLILVLKNEDKPENNEYELVELYQDKEGQWSSFCKARIHSMTELERAYNDVKQDGPNDWFYENGDFAPDVNNFWDWTPRL